MGQSYPIAHPGDASPLGRSVSLLTDGVPYGCNRAFAAITDAPRVPRDEAANRSEARYGPGMSAKESKRLAYLLKLTSSENQGSIDPFAFYGLAMEYRSLERYEDAVATFQDLRARDPSYVPMYLMCGQMLEKIGRADAAREWLASGIAAARAKGDAHAMGELEGALAALA